MQNVILLYCFVYYNYVWKSCIAGNSNVCLYYSMTTQTTPTFQQHFITHGSWPIITSIDWEKSKSSMVRVCNPIMYYNLLKVVHGRKQQCLLILLSHMIQTTLSHFPTTFHYPWLLANNHLYRLRKEHLYNYSNWDPNEDHGDHNFDKSSMVWVCNPL